MLSIVVPTLNAGLSLGRTLAALEGADEIVVADGGSHDDTAAIARRAGVRVVPAPKGRGSQLAAGAKAAQGDWLLFLHADTTLDTGWRAAVASHVTHGRGSAACFGFRLDADAWQARLIERGVALRVRLLGLPYGDQGLLVSRALYEEVGGFAPLAIMEDVDFVRRIGRRRMRVLQASATTSARRWRGDGWLRRSARNLLCLLLYGMGVAPQRIAEIYAARRG